MQTLYCTHSFSLVLCEELDHLAMYELVFIHGQGIFPKDSALWDGKCSSHGCSKARLVILKEACSGNPKTGNLTFKLAVPMCAVTSKVHGLHHRTLGCLQTSGFSYQLPGVILVFASNSIAALVKSDALSWQAGKRTGVPTASTLWLF